MSLVNAFHLVILLMMAMDTENYQRGKGFNKFGNVKTSLKDLAPYQLLFTGNNNKALFRNLKGLDILKLPVPTTDKI